MRTIVAMAATFCLVNSSIAATVEHCFRRDDSKRLNFDVFQVGFPPAFDRKSGDYPATSGGYPGSYYTTFTLATMTRPTPRGASGFSFRKGDFLWANRCIHMRGITPDLESCRNTRRYKANGYYKPIKDAAGRQIRPAFSTYAKANACTMIQAESRTWPLRWPDGWLMWTRTVVVTSTEKRM